MISAATAGYVPVDELIHKIQGNTKTINPKTGQIEWRKISPPQETAHTVIDSLIDKSKRAHDPKYNEMLIRLLERMENKKQNTLNEQ